MINKIVKLTPLAGTFLVFLGVLKLIFYYSYFDIQIIDYLEFQEIITSFFGDINIIIIFGFSMVLISFVTLNFISKKANLNIDDVAKKIMIFLYPRRFIYFIVFFLIVLIIKLSLLFFDFLRYNYFLIYLLSFCSIQMLTYLFLSKDEKGNIDISNFYGILILGLSLSFSIYLFAQKDIQETMSNTEETIINTKNEIIYCNNQTNNMYIGKTSKYTFLKKSNSIIAIPNTEIIEYEFKQIRLPGMAKPN